MAISIDSTIKELLDDEKAKPVLERHVPQLISHPQLSMAKGMTLKQVAPMSQGMLTDDMVKAIDKDQKPRFFKAGSFTSVMTRSGRDEKHTS